MNAASRRDGRPANNGHGDGSGASGYLWLAGSEPDGLAGQALGLVAAGVPGRNGGNAECARRLAGKKLVITFPCDAASRQLARRVSADALPHAKEVRVLDLDPTRADGYNLTALLREASECGANGIAQARALLERAAAMVDPIAAPGGDPLADRLINVAALLDEPDEPIPWRCDRFAADGEVTVLTGHGGEGQVVSGARAHGRRRARVHGGRDQVPAG